MAEEAELLGSKESSACVTRAIKDIEVWPALRAWWSNAACPLSPCLVGCSSTTTNRLSLRVRLPHANECSENEIAMQHWDSSRLLAQLVLSVPELVRKKHVLEIGAGFHGCVALAASHSGAIDVIATDSYEPAVRLCQENLDAHKSHNVAARRLNYKHLDEQERGAFDIVLGADLVYLDSMAKFVVAALVHFVAPGGLAVLVCPTSMCRDGCEELARLLQACEELSCYIYGMPAHQFECYVIRKRVRLDELD
eukprot:TRINITY_DN50326_c0_g1_i1.p1 TRINITY_DN50326_c0_g1~~TRINITY_DN50326_c0_g1_i1.p1  ORF type:complete len:252 (+),score=18.94 TRINITY_DN50326_c0_g1_i1:269-1024(+)